MRRAIAPVTTDRLMPTTILDSIVVDDSPRGPLEPAPRLVKRRRHLMDPNAPRPVHDSHAEQQSLSRVQRWVMSVLAVTTIVHFSAGLVLAALVLPHPTLTAQIGLSIIAGVCGVMAVTAAFAIHGRRVASWWLLLGLLPTAAGLWLTLS